MSQLSLAIPAAMLLVPLYAANDRFAGGGSPKLDAKLPGRGFVWGSLICAGVGYVAGGWPLTLMALVWTVYRCLPWSVGGTTTPHGGQIAAAFLRHAMPLGAAAACAVNGVWGFNWLPLMIGLAAYAVAATALAVKYAKHVDGLIARGAPDNGEHNARLELIRGGLFGAALAASAILTQ